MPLSGGDSGDGTLRLDAVDGNGPICMALTELAPDTILINEVDSASGKIVLTASLSLVTAGGVSGRVSELVQVSHEVGDTIGSGSSSSDASSHAWRLQASSQHHAQQGSFRL